MADADLRTEVVQILERHQELQRRGELHRHRGRVAWDDPQVAKLERGVVELTEGERDVDPARRELVGVSASATAA